MSNFDAYNLDEQAAITHLKEQGYVVIENLLDTNEIGVLSKAIDRIFKQEREKPFNPSDINDDEDDQSLREYLINSYKISENESERLMNRIKHTRKLNHDTPWPLPPDKMNKSFLHVPTLFDYDKSQRIWNLPAKLQQSEKLIEHPILLSLVRAMLDEDCVLSDISATSIGPKSGGSGAWHIDAPLTQMPEPLPEIPLAVQNAWIIDDFTVDNGATHVVPKSHLSRKKPGWGYDDIENEIVLSAPAGSLAMWTSHTWHKSGENITNTPRRAILGYYIRSWIRPWSDFTRVLSPEQAKQYSPTARYLLGYSAYPPNRG